MAIARVVLRCLGVPDEGDPKCGNRGCSRGAGGRSWAAASGGLALGHCCVRNRGKLCTGGRQELGDDDDVMNDDSSGSIVCLGFRVDESSVQPGAGGRSWFAAAGGSAPTQYCVGNCRKLLTGGRWEWRHQLRCVEWRQLG